VEFRILGPLEVRAAGQAVELPGAKPRAVLAVLLLHANQPVSAEQLAVALWGEEAPAGAVNTVQVHVSRLRKALGDTGVLVTRPSGYELRLEVDQLDSHRFEERLAEGRSELAAGRVTRAAAILEEALSLWRGRPLDDLAYEPFAQREIARLEDLRVEAFEQLVEAKLALGRHAEVVGQLETLIAEHPYRERPRAQLMLALYRCDRQADALQVYQDARRQLVEELGIEPGERLRELERAILAQDRALTAPAPAHERFDAVEQPAPTDAAAEKPESPGEPGEPRSARRVVSVVFAGIAGSTGLAERLDPESMHGLLDRYSDVCSTVIERHGGTVDGFVGDALVGVFGQTQVHEDDSLRAIRAAVELREAGAALERDRGVRLGMKLGVESGEVFVSAGTRRSRFAAGGAFNVAARLEATAAEGEILLGDDIHRLVEDAVRAERLEPLALSGRTTRLQLWRLVELEAERSASVRPHTSPFVGRRPELDALRAAFTRTREGQGCDAVTVVGPAGIGKSRLAHELIAGIGDEATVVVGGCPSYGEGVTYRPLAEMIGQLGDGDSRRRVAELLDGDGPAARIVLAAIGLAAGPAQTEETFWAFRTLFERLAQERPLVVVVEDVHWAQPTLLDMLEYLLVFSSGQAILLVCLARPELLETRPAWAAPQPDRSLLVLDALSDGEARQLVESAAELSSGTAARIVETAEGNPLFLEQLAAIGADGGETTLPTSIQAVLAARIERLDPAERALLEHASVQGPSFYVGALQELLPERDRTGTATRLVSLVHRQLIRAERSEFPGQDAFRFAHVLIREAAYRGLPKQRRAELHERVARWLESRAGAQDETIGYHLAEAYRHRAELGHAGAREQALAGAAAERLAAAADAALLRGDPAAGARLLEGAGSLLDWDDAARGEVLPELGAALFEAGRMDDATRVLDEAIAAAPEPRLLARAQVERELVRLETEPGVAPDRARAVVAAARPVLERDADQYGQCRAWLLRGQVEWNAGRVAAADDAWREAAECARRAGSPRELFEVVGWRATAAALGPTPVDPAIRRCREFRELVSASPIATASTLNPLALLHAMKGEFETAGRLLEQAGEILREVRGLGAGVSHLEAFARLLAGQPALAEAPLRNDVETLAAMSEGAALATTTALLAQALYAQGRVGEAAELCRVAERRAAAEDTVTQVIWRGVQARILARQGRCDEAQALARGAVALVEQTDLLSHRGDAMLDLADVLHICERRDESERAARTGLALYERKGNAAAAARARALLRDRGGGE
jgi:DNA-binding SARP family transcriptional activator